MQLHQGYLCCSRDHSVIVGRGNFYSLDSFRFKRGLIIGYNKREHISESQYKLRKAQEENATSPVRCLSQFSSESSSEHRDSRLDLFDESSQPLSCLFLNPESVSTTLWNVRRRLSGSCAYQRKMVYLAAFPFL